MNYEATKSYQQKLSRKEILKFTFSFQSSLISSLIRKFNLIPVEPPLISKHSDNDIKTLITKSRSISFDTDSSEMFLQIPTSYDIARRNMLDDYEIDINEGIIYNTPVLMRDAKLGNLKSLKWNQIEFELHLPSEGNKSFEFLVDFLHDLSKALSEALNFAKNETGMLENENKFSTIPTKTITDLKKKFGPVAEKDKEYLECQEKDVYFLCNDSRESDKIIGRSFHFNPQTHRRLFHSRLVSNFSLLGTHSNLAEVAFSCDYQEQLEQVSMLINPENDSYSKKLRSGNSKLSIGVKIYLPRVIMYLLDLCHVSEVTNSKWDDDFLSFAKKQGIKIL